MRDEVVIAYNNREADENDLTSATGRDDDVGGQGDGVLLVGIAERPVASETVVPADFGPGNDVIPKGVIESESAGEQLFTRSGMLDFVNRA